MSRTKVLPYMHFNVIARSSRDVAILLAKIDKIDVLI